MKFFVGLAAGIIVGVAAVFLIAPRLGAGGETGGTGRIAAPADRGGGWSRTPAVSFTAAESATVGVTLESIGEVRASRSIEIAAEATGVLETINFAPGQRVKKGDLVFKIDDREQQIALARTRAQYPIAKRNAERYQRLARQDAASALEAENAQNTLEQVEADLRAAEFAVSQRTVRAPFDGVVGLTRFEPGDLVNAGDVVTTLDDTVTVVIEFPIPQEAAADMTIGQKAWAQEPMSRGAPIEGLVTAVDSRVDPVTRTLLMEARFDNASGRMTPGAVFEVETMNEGAEGLSLPALAIQWDRTGPFVYTLDDEGRAKRAGVAILQRSDDVAIVSGALDAGDLVVSEGADRVRPGMPLRRSSALGAGGGASAGGLD